MSRLNAQLNYFKELKAMTEAQRQNNFFVRVIFKTPEERDCLYESLRAILEMCGRKYPKLEACEGPVLSATIAGMLATLVEASVNPQSFAIHPEVLPRALEKAAFVSAIYLSDRYPKRGDFNWCK